MILIGFPGPEEAGQEIYTLQYIFVKLDVLHPVYFCGGVCAANTGE